MVEKTIGPKIIVITPVKDEDWILDRFLWACSHFADHIVLLNQGSTDRTLEIIDDYDEAVCYENPSPKYDEAYRTEFLVGKVRELYGEGNLIVALDADEIPTFPSLDRRLWGTLRKLEPGTTVWFAKPDLLSQPMRYLPCNTSFPLAYVDDGAETQKKRIHNRRIPGNADGPVYVCQSIIVLHFARIREFEYRARQAMYSVVENINRTKSWYKRVLYYSPQAHLSIARKKSKVVPRDWAEGYFERGIDFYGFRTQRFNSFHRKVLGYFEQYGSQKFFWDDIWDIDWELLQGISEEVSALKPSLPVPNIPTNFLRKYLVKTLFLLSRLRMRVR